MILCGCLNAHNRVILADAQPTDAHNRVILADAQPTNDSVVAHF
jgi:hypothetical protein